MAKRKTSPGKTQITVVDLVPQYVDGGIYRHVESVQEQTRQITEAEREAAFARAEDTAGSLVEHLGEIESLAADTLRPFVQSWDGRLESIPANHITGVFNLGDGMHAYTAPKNLPLEATTAQETLQLVDEMLTDIGRGTSADALAGAYRLGRLAERLRVLPFERDTKRGKKVLTDASAGGKTRRILRGKNAKQAKARRDELIAAGRSKSDASVQVGREWGVSGKTISRL